MPSQGNTSGKKADKISAELRVRSVQEWILQGYSHDDILNNAMQKWQIGERQASKYYRKAFELFRINNQLEMQEKKAVHIAMREKLYRDLKDKTSAEGARAALKILDSNAKIDGILVPVKISVNNQATANADVGLSFDNSRKYTNNEDIIRKIKEIESKI